MSGRFEALTTAWRERGFSPSSLEERGDGTLVASERQLSVDSRTLALGGAAAGAGEPTAEPLELLGELGRGGMGVVSAARQLPLRREVAVKRAAQEGGALRPLLKEAWVGGHLEHPNIVPVHTLAEGPAVVMKKIEGTAWRDFIRGAAPIPEGNDDPLRWHLDVLLAVCDAIAFAHARGVLHLDLKPDNVMIGAFGEVYVLDWGLAAGLGDAAPDWLPPARDLRSVAGTPDYMAPELALGRGDSVDARTDVYLLGAMLHEVVTGRPPHSGDGVMQRLFRAYRSEPHDYGDAAPEELSALLHRAMHVDPARRFDGVPQLRDAIRAFLAHREADGFVREAKEQLATIGQGADEVAIWRGFGACRFALREAERGWPEHPDLAALKGRLAERMALWAMDAGRLELAKTYLDEVDDPAEDLRARLDALVTRAREQAERLEQLERLERQHSLDVSARFRRRFAIALGLSFFLVNAAMGGVERAGLASFGYPELLVLGGVTAAVLGPFVWWQRARTFSNKANAAIFGVCTVTFVVVQGLWMVGLGTGLPFRTALALTPMFYLLAFGAFAMLVSLRFSPSPLVQVPTVIAGALFPEHLYEIIGVGGGLSAALVGLAWPARADDPERGVEATA